MQNPQKLMNVKKFMSDYTTNEPSPDYHSEEEGKSTVVGFSLNKILDNESLFYGLPSLGGLLQYADIISSSLILLPNKDDHGIIRKIKFANAIWGMSKFFLMNKSSAQFTRPNLEEIGFGRSSNIIWELLNNIMEPDEVFKSESSIFGIRSNLYRFPIKNGYVYFCFTKSEYLRGIRITKNITTIDILDVIWEKFNGVIQLESIDDVGLVQTRSSLSNKKVFGSSLKLIETMKEDYAHFNKKNMSRSYLLIGKPGTGKTSIVNSIVKNIKGNVFIISGIDSALTVGEMSSLFVHMRPDFIVFDDCDRSESTPSIIKYVLKMLEEVKDNNSGTTFLFTANSFSGILYDEAVTRRGRIDRIYELKEPDINDRREIFARYSEELNTNLTQGQLEMLAQNTQNLTGADIKEICIQLGKYSVNEVLERSREIDLLREKYPANNNSRVSGIINKTLQDVFESALKTNTNGKSELKQTLQ